MKIVRSSPRRIIRSKEASFQRQLKLAFAQMKTGQFKFVRKLPGTVYTSVFPKNLDILSSPPQVQDFIKVLGFSSREAFDVIKQHQIIEYLKNSRAYGGNALVVIRRYNAYKKGRIRQILEVIVWDNGPGIKDLKQALEQEYSSRKHIFSNLFGAGKGLDFIYRWEDAEKTVPRYAANELVIETDYQKVQRKTSTSIYNFSPSGTNIPGTKVTAHFWL